jgi:hypothetical protein
VPEQLQPNFLPVFANNVSLPSPLPLNHGTLPQAQQGLPSNLPLFLPSPSPIHPLELSSSSHLTHHGPFRQTEDRRLLVNTDHPSWGQSRSLEHKNDGHPDHGYNENDSPGRPLQATTSQRSFQASDRNRVYFDVPQQLQSGSHPPAQRNGPSQYVYADQAIQGEDRRDARPASRWNEDSVPAHPSRFLARTPRVALDASVLPEHLTERASRYSSLQRGQVPHQHTSFDGPRTSNTAHLSSSLSRLPQAHSGSSHIPQNSNLLLDGELAMITTYVLLSHTLLAPQSVRILPPTKSWIVAALGIVPLDPRNAAHTYVTSIAVPDASIVTLRTLLTVLGREYHQVPYLHEIEDKKWQTWEMSWFAAYTPTTERCPWYFLPTSGVYKAIQVPDGLDRQLLVVLPGASGYNTALKSAQSRSHIGMAYLPEDTPVYSLYFNKQVRNTELHYFIRP